MGPSVVASSTAVVVVVVAVVVAVVVVVVVAVAVAVTAVVVVVVVVAVVVAVVVVVAVAAMLMVPRRSDVPRKWRVSVPGFLVSQNDSSTTQRVSTRALTPTFPHKHSIRRR